MAKNPPQNAALGSYEAACVIGVHFTRIAKMAEAGTLKSRLLRSSSADIRIRVYSFSDLCQNWDEYVYSVDKKLRSRRRRTNEDLREPMIRELAAMPAHIDFYDAVSVYEAAEILGVWYSYVPRLAAAGGVVGRRLINHRQTKSRAMIYSRKSCEENAELARRMADTPTKGRSRHGL